MDKVFQNINSNDIDKFKKSIIETLSLYLIESATNQGFIDTRTRDNIIRSI